MALIYLVQSSSDLTGSAGYCRGLLEAEHKRLLVSFGEYAGKNLTIVRESRRPQRAPPPLGTMKSVIGRRTYK